MSSTARLVPERIDALVARAQQDVDEGNIPACQLAIAREGEVIFQTAIGDCTVDTRFAMFSATKPVVASMVWRLIGEGLVDVSATVASVIPEFGTNGKEGITIEQVMLHTSGFPAAPLGAPQWWTRDGRLERFGQWRTNWEPGTKFEYHPTSAHWVLAEIIERVRGKDYREIIQAEIIGPLGLAKLRLGVPENEQGDIATLAVTGEPATPEELMAALGISEMPVTEVTDEALLGFNSPAVRALGVPGGGGISTAADHALFYQALLHNDAGLWDADVLADAKTNIRNTFPDVLMGMPANRSLGLCISGADPGVAAMNGFGKTNSAGAFGHNGAGGQIAWADPDTGLSFVYLTNGLDAHPIRQARRGVAVSSRANLVTTPVEQGQAATRERCAP